MNIVDWLESLSDVPGHIILDYIKRDIEGMHQLNEYTSIKLIDSHHYRLPMTVQQIAPLSEQRYKTIRTKKRIQEWSYRGFKAVMWRIWGAILEGVPENGHEIIERKERIDPMIAPDNYQTRNFTMKEYGFMGWGLDRPIRLVFFYDPMSDTLYTLKDYARG